MLLTRRHSPTQPCSVHHLTLLLLGVFLFLQVACKNEDRVDRATREKILLIGNGAEPKALDPQLVSSVGDSNIAGALFEGLVAFHPSVDAKHAPGVAKSWESNADFTEWTFHLRENAKWSNGDPVTAHDFVYAYSRILDPDLGSPYSSMLFFLKNGEKFNKQEVDSFADVGVKAVGDFTLVCTLNVPVHYFPDVVKHTTWMPVHQGTIEKFGSKTDNFTDWQKPGNHVGNGPFMVTDWRINSHVKVRKNPHYWDANTVQLEGIDFLPLDNTFTEERAFRDGLVHVTYILPSNLIQQYRDEKPEVLRTEKYAGTYFFRFNQNKAPMNNIHFRKAISYAIDRQQIVTYVTQGGQTPAHGFTPPTEGGYQPPNMLSFNPEKAREHLKKAGFSSGKEVPKFAILINSSEAHKAIAEAIQDMLKDNLGIEKVEISNQEWKVFQQTLTDMNYQVARSAWIADYLDPFTFLSIWQEDDTNNETGWANPKYDQLLHDAAFEPTQEARFKMLQDAERILVDELPIIPIYWYTSIYLVHPDVKNLNPLLLRHPPYKHIRLSAGE